MREIKRIILHCSATVESIDYTAEDIKHWHRARGFYDIGYHFVITRDGKVQKGRDLDEIGAHAKGHNRNSIGICYIGGLDNKRQPKDTLNTDQERSLHKLVDALRLIFGELHIQGHNELSNKACPCFDVSERLEYLL